MHHHHIDMFSGTEAGVRFAEYAWGVDRPNAGPSGGNKPGSRPASADAAERRAADQRAKASPAVSADAAERRAADEKAASRNSSPAAKQAREAIKDGKIQPNEKSVVKKAAVRDAITGERTRLEESVKKAEGKPEHQRDDAGKLKLKDGKPITDTYGRYADTDHERLVKDLVKNKEKHGLEAIDKDIATLKEKKVTTGLAALEQNRAGRAGQELQVVGVIEEKESLRGTLEAEKVALEADAPKASRTDFQDLREQARPWLAQFNENGGQTHEADLFSEDWDDQKGDVTFEQLAKDLSNETRLNDFVKVQGDDNDGGGDDDASMDDHIAEVATKEPAEGARIALRYQAAQKLHGIISEYNEAKGVTDGNDDAIKQINAEIGILDASIKDDRAALSPEMLERIDKDNAADTKVIPAATKADAADDAGENGDDIGHADGGAAPGGAGGTEPGHADGGAAPDGAKGTEPGHADGGAAPNGAGDPEPGHADGGAAPGGAGKVTIDYAKPENRDRVLTKAQERNLVPAENTTFDDKGQAVYTVQPNDSYWRISDRSDGKQEFDPQHFAATVQSNSERLGRDPQVGLIHPNEQIVIPGRSVQELVTLLGMPATEQVEKDE